MVFLFFSVYKKKITCIGFVYNIYFHFNYYCIIS